MAKFEITSTSDGTLEAESFIKENGGIVTARAVICYEGKDPEVLEAIAFLCDEWDYTWIEGL